MVTHRNRRTPSGNCALIPVNTETVRGWKPGIGDDSERLRALASGDQSECPETSRTVVRGTGYRTMFRRNSGPLLGVSASRPKRGRLSANKGTREARSSRAVTQPPWHPSRQASPMRRTSGGVAVVVRGWESQPHGEGRQEMSFWTAEAFGSHHNQPCAGDGAGNREGSR
jgi:hypothetical protein